MAPRSVTHHAADARRFLKTKDERYLREYIGKHAVRILVADDLLPSDRRELVQKLREALKPLQYLAEERP